MAITIPGNPPSIDLWRYYIDADIDDADIETLAQALNQYAAASLSPIALLDEPIDIASTSSAWVTLVEGRVHIPQDWAQISVYFAGEGTATQALQLRCTIGGNTATSSTFTTLGGSSADITATAGDQDVLIEANMAGSSVFGTAHVVHARGKPLTAANIPTS